MNNTAETVRVRVYFNLHTKVWSIQHKGKVIGHRTHVRLTNCVAKVNEKARLRVIERKCREVHAVIEGELVEFASPDSSFERFTYNPYRSNGFHIADVGRVWWNASEVVFNGREAWVKEAV